MSAREIRTNFAAIPRERSNLAATKFHVLEPDRILLRLFWPVWWMHGIAAKISALVCLVVCFSIVALSVPARADCASGGGVITAPGLCATPQNLTGPSGIIVSGATLSTGLNTTAYTVSSSNGAVTNAGVVTGQGQQAFLVSGTFAGSTPTVVNLANTGSISAPTGIGIFVAGGTLNLINQRNISGLLNTPAGNVFGPAIPVSGAIVFNPGASGGTIMQTGGTIDGGIFLSGLQTVLNVTGGSVNGPIADRTPASGAAGSSQFRGGTVNFDLGAGSFTTNGDISVGAVIVRSGTLVLGNDVYVSGVMGGAGLINNARLQINGMRTVTGSFVQNAGGSLVMQVTPTSSSQLNIAQLPFFGGGTATLAGTLVLAYEPGIYNARSYTLLSAPNGINGTFSAVSGSVPTAGLTQSVSVGTQSVDLTLGQVVVAPTNDTIFTSMTSSLVQGAQHASGLVLDRIDAALSGSASGPVLGSLAPPTPAQFAQLRGGNLATLGDAAASLPDALPQGGWFHGIGSFASVNGSSTAPGFSADQGGFMAGFDRQVLPDLLVGVAGGYTHTDANEHTPATSTADTGRVIAYGGAVAGGAIWAGSLGYAHDWISSSRTLSGIGAAAENHAGNELTAAGQWALPLTVTGIMGNVTLTPKAGVQFLNLWEGGFTETGGAGFDLSADGHSTTSVQPFIGLSASETFVTDAGLQITPELGLSYARELANDSRTLTVDAVSGTNFLVQGVKPSRDMLHTTAGLTIRAQDNLFVYAAYDSLLRTGNIAAQTISAGLRLRF